MKGPQLKAARRVRGWSQQEAARRLGVTQAYLSMMEKGRRRVPAGLARKLVSLYRLPPTELSLPRGFHPQLLDPQTLAEQLGALGYPGFAWMARGRKRNPAEVLLSALAQSNLEARLLEGLPWLLLRHWDMDADWLLENARRLNLQNRLGFLVNLARRLKPLKAGQVSECNQTLASLERRLEQCRLAQEDALCQARMTAAERKWLATYRPKEAEFWNLWSDLRPEHLAYASKS